MTKQSTDTTGIEDWLDDLDVSDLHPRDASYLRAIMDANEQLQAARSGLDRAVWRARQAGDSWAAIGAALGVTRQAAQSRFAAVAAGPAPASKADIAPSKVKLGKKGYRHLYHARARKTALVTVMSGKVIKVKSGSAHKIARPHRHVDADLADRKR